ncbi:MAG: tetratricopeptide repeat protein [Deltaproteobacteria bacterium]|nr:tetratricopeptide repeat protein [Deltaproteobacteria bacterium]
MFNTKNRTRLKFIVSLFLVLTTLIAYWQLPCHDFIRFDDNWFIVKNFHVHKGITWESIAWAFSITDYAYWHPLTWLSHILAFQLFGLKSSMHLLINLFLHIANILLLFIVLKRMTGSLWRSAFVAAMFALHPMNVESVAWASECKNVLSTFFWMLTMLTYARYAEHPGFYRYLMTLIVFALGLMAKPMLVTLPFVLLLFDYWPLCRFKLFQSGGMGHEFRWSPVLRLVLEKIPFLSLSAVCIYLSSLSVQRLEIVISTASVPMKLRIYNALVSYVSYIKKMAWPHNLAVYYPYPESIPFWKVAGAALFLICVSILVVRALKSKPYLAVGWFWYIGTLVPAIGLVQAGLWPSIADRFAYVPLIGLFIVIAWGIPDLVAQWRCKKIALAATAIVLLLTFTAATWFQNKYWQNSVTLFSHNVNVTQNNRVAHNVLGNALQQQGKLNEAISHYAEALKIDPNYAEAHNNLGYTLTRQKHYKEAIYHYHEALRINPTHTNAYNNLGTALLHQGNEEEAIYYYYEALKSNPKYAGAYYNLGKILLNRGKTEKAINFYRKALKFEPEMTQALYNLSWILASYEDKKYRNGEEAVRLAEKLCKITRYRQPLALDALAAAYAEAGRFTEAILTAQKGLELALWMGPKELALGLENRLKLYHAKRPYRQNSHK